jgi:SAM-dependent methyltransferase
MEAQSDNTRDRGLRALANYSGDPWVPAHPYFQHAENSMVHLWENLIWPFISDTDFTAVLDLAAGHGRNSVKLLEHATALCIMDIQPGNIDECRRRFEDCSNVRYFVNNGYDFTPVTDESISLIYCFDAMVHFDSDVVRSYLHDAMRILTKGGHGFFHHSNYIGGEDWQLSPAARNFMSAPLFRHYADKEGLLVIRQKIINWDRHADHDCLTLVQRPAH